MECCSALACGGSDESSSERRMRAVVIRRPLLAPSLVAWWAVIPVFVLLVSVIPGAAEEAPPSTGSSTVDCRFDFSRPMPAENGVSQPVEAFPENDVFRPLLADLKQPRFFATWQVVHVHNPSPALNLGSRVNVGSVGFGENFGLVGRRNGCDGWQVGILAGVFAQFNLDSGSTDLINADYVVGFPVSWRSGLVSARVRLSHQSSHLGDEFILGNPGFQRVNLSFEEVEAILSLDTPGGWGRVYAGSGYAFHREPANLDPIKVQWGLELRGPSYHSPILGRVLPDLRLVPVFGVDFKTFEELDWVMNANVVGGLEWYRPGASRRVRFLVNYYNGFPQYGQFFAQSKIQTVGFGFYLEF